MSEKKLIPGRVWTLSGTDYTIPALSVKGVNEAQEKNLDAFMKLRTILPALEAVNRKIEEATKTTDRADEDMASAIQEALEKAKEAQRIEFDTACTTAYMAFKRNYPEVSYDDFLDLPTASEVKEIAAWALVGDQSAKKD